ncbi:phage major tail protein 2 [uncultured Mediterranean phage uvMED]|nr:phage major tail protein 2 [uncultured Mediterranean phage uvMED]
MSIYLGTHGKVELQRKFDGEIRSSINPSDINVTAKRFSFDFGHGQLLTGDQIEIFTAETSGLTFINGYSANSIKKFIYVDELDGIRLYDSFAHAVNGGSTNATALATPSGTIEIRVIVENAIDRLLAQVSSFEINTQRESVDTTVLSDDFRKRFDSVISGSGQFSAFWEYTGDTANELPHYLLELALRTRVGSNFSARLYLKDSGHNPSGVAARSDDSIWYEVEGLISAAAVQFSPDSVVQITADFVTTGPIQIRMNLSTPSVLKQEAGDDLLLDQDGTAKLAQDSQD